VRAESAATSESRAVRPSSIGDGPAPASISEEYNGPTSVAVGIPTFNSPAKKIVKKSNRKLTFAEQRAANQKARYAKQQAAYQAKQAQAAAHAAWMAKAAPGQVVTKRQPVPVAPEAPVVSVSVPEWKRRALYGATRSQRYGRWQTAARPLAPKPVVKRVVKTVAVKHVAPKSVAPKPVAVKPVVVKPVAVKPVAVTKAVTHVASPKPVVAAQPTHTPEFPVAATAAVSAALPAAAPVAQTVPAPVPVAPAPVAPSPAPTQSAPVTAATDLESRPLAELHPEEKSSSRPASGNVIVDVLMKLVSVVGLIGACAVGWKKMQGLQGRKAAQSLETVQVNSTASLGPQRFLHVVTVGQQRFLVSSSPQQISLIAPIDENTSSEAALASADFAAAFSVPTTPAAPAIPAAPVAPVAPAPKVAPAPDSVVAPDDARYNDLLRQIRAVGVSVDPTPVAPPSPVRPEARPTYASLSEAMNAPSNGRGVSMFRTENESDEASRNA
jgi:flagellar biogenesis protein FliO